MDFIGTGARLKQGDIGEAARLLGIETAVLLAVIEVEANGRGFDSRNRPVILPERHRFWKHLKVLALRDRAAAEGLAYPEWGTKPYPKTSDARYDMLVRMMVIDIDAALRSTSWGLPQILGENYDLAGFANVLDMVKAMMQGEREQLLAMCAFIEGTGLDDELRRRDWHGFAKGYNGPAYAKNAYHTKLAKAYAKHAGGEQMDLPTIDGVLMRGMKGELVMGLQRDLVLLRYDLGADGVDGRFGPKTEEAVRQFQFEHSLAVDGRVGTTTKAAMTVAIEALRGNEIPPAPPVWEGQEATLPPAQTTVEPEPEPQPITKRAGFPPMWVIWCAIIFILAAAGAAFFS